ncbi:MAG: glycosyltransferase family 1 protein [Thermodesulfobacteriota bacterium]
MTFSNSIGMLPAIMPADSLKIGIIYGGISEQKAGMDHYLHQVLSAMNKLAPQHRYVLIDHRRHFIPFKDRFEQRIIDLPPGPARVSRWNLRQVPKLLSEFDLVFSPGLYGPVKIPGGTASVMVVHDLTRYLFPDFFAFNAMQKILDLLAYPAMLRRYDHIMTVSQATKQDLIARFRIPEGKITVAYHGAEASFCPGERSEARKVLEQSYRIKGPFILFLGTLEPRKNIPTLIRAFAGLTEHIPHHLILVGQKGWKWEPIFAEMERPEIKERVRWIGYVPDEHRVFFYNAAEMLAYPSWYEGFGMPLLEAMQCGCPVIASNTSAMPEVVGEAALLIDPGRVEDLQGAILRLIRDPVLAETLRKSGPERARKFSWESSARITLEVFEKVMERQARRPKAVG